MKVVVGVLTLSLFAVVCAEGQTRLDDELLLKVGKSQLKESRDITCVRGPNQDIAALGISDWLFQELRRGRGSLTRCKGNAMFDERTQLILGPVERFTTPSRVRVYFGSPASVVSRDGYEIIRGKFGRWRWYRLARD
jgi:hypothetical protein